MLRHPLWTVLVSWLSQCSCANQVIWIIGFQPFTGNVWDAGISTHIGADIMLQEINANPNLLPGYEMRIVWQDGFCDGDRARPRFLENIAWQKYYAFAPGKAISELDADGDAYISEADVAPFEEVWNSSIVHPKPVGLLGAACSGPTIELAKLAPMLRMPHVCGAASRADLSDRARFPNFFRTHTPDSLLSPAWFAVTKDLGLSTALVVLSDIGFAAQATAFLGHAQSAGITVVGNDFTNEVAGFFGCKVKEVDVPSAAEVAADLIKYQQRVVAIGSYGKTLRIILCEAYKRSFFNGVYMIYGWVAFGWWSTPDTDCTPEQLEGMALGYMGASQQYFRTEMNMRLACSTSMTVQSFMTEMWRRQNATPGDWSAQPAGFIPRKESAPHADAICMYAQALHDVLITRGIALSELTDRTPAGYTAMVDAFAATDFEGVTSRVRFPPGSGDPEASVLLEQLQRDGGSLRLVELATYNRGLNYLGRGNFVFQLPGETFPAGPAGATTVSESLSQFAVCTNNQVLDMSTNRCESCAENTTFAQFAKACLCSPGFYQTASGCAPCPGGTYSSAAGTTTCTPCALGTFSPPKSTQCSFCPTGSFADRLGMEVCRSCPALKTTMTIASLNADACVCEAGAYSNGDGTCSRCPATAVTQGLDSRSSSSCLCGENTYMNNLSCTPCPAGSSTDGIGKVNLDGCRCARGTYMSAGSCVPCPSGSTTSGEGRTNIKSCLCARGTYMPLTAQGCLPCPEGLVCEVGSNEANAAYIPLAAKTEEQRFPRLAERYWASLEEPMSIFECRDGSRCPGGDQGNACAPNLHKRNCDFCIQGYTWNGEECTPCSGLESSPILFPLLPILIAPLLLVILYRFFGDTYEKWGSWRNGISTVAFITLNHYQLVDAVLNCNIVFPRFLMEVLGIWASSNNFTANFNLDCMGMSDIKSSILIRGLIPVIFAGCCVLVYGLSQLVAKLAQKAWLAMDRDRMLNIYGSLVFTFFNAIAALSLVLFKCKDNPNNTKSLDVDLSVICFASSEWQSLLIGAIVLLLVYSVGVGGLLIRTVIVAPKYFSCTGFQARWKFLFIKYRVDVYWWSIVYLMMNFLINLGFVVAFEGITQLHLVMLVTGAYMAFLIVMKPYRHRVANFLDVFARVSIIYISALLTWHVERRLAPGFVDTAVNGAVASVSLLPTLTALCAIAYLVRFGKNYPSSPKEVAEAGKEFQELVDHVMELSLLSHAEGAKLILALEEWDRWYLKQGTKAISADVMGMSQSSRVVDKGLSQRIRGRIETADPKALEEAVAQHVHRITGNEEIVAAMRTTSMSEAADGRNPEKTEKTNPDQARWLTV